MNKLLLKGKRFLLSHSLKSIFPGRTDSEIEAFTLAEDVLSDKLRADLIKIGLDHDKMKELEDLFFLFSTKQRLKGKSDDYTDALRDFLVFVKAVSDMTIK